MTKAECELALKEILSLASPCSLEVYEHRSSYLKERYELLEQLIKEHFELVEKIKWLKEEMTEPAFNLVFSTQEFLHNWYKGIQMYSSENAVLQRKVSEYENPQPYKFEELKKGMWVWDDKGLYCFECNPAISKNGTRCVTYNSFWYNSGEDEDEFFEEYDEFEEGRFFPVTKAMEHQK